MKQKTKQFNDAILQDIAIVTFSVLMALILVKTDVLVSILTKSSQLEMIGSFISGLFFTSVFTTAPAIVTLGEIAQVYSIFWTAVFGALGALIGDLIIFRFVKDRLSKHIIGLLKHGTGTKRIKVLLKMRTFRWITFFVGCLIIASPLPDELGVGLMGFSKTKTSFFAPMSFIFNFIGIVIVGLVARS